MTKKGSIYALLACLIWGLIFIIPPYLKGFDALEIALGRHGVYGLLSCCLALISGQNLLKKHPLPIWKKAFLFSFVCNILYYVCVVMGVQYANPAITALILGTSPVFISFYGNWKERQCSFKSLVLPSVFILLGLLLINLPAIQEWMTPNESDLERGEGKLSYVWGSFAAGVSLIAWSWYVVANAKFLKTHTSISSQEWSTLVGVTTFIWVVTLSIAYKSWQGKEHLIKFTEVSDQLLHYLGGCTVLGIGCSWVGAYFWNKASLLLPVSFAGQLLIFETIFGLLYYYLIKQEIPPTYELAGVSLMLGAIFYGMNSWARDAHALTE